MITKQEAALRSDYADAVAQVHAAAEEAGLDSAMVMQSWEESVANGELPLAAVGHAVADAKEKAIELAAAAAAAAASEDAAATQVHWMQLTCEPAEPAEPAHAE